MRFYEKSIRSVLRTKLHICYGITLLNLRIRNNISTSCSANNYNPPRLYMAKNMIADVAAESTGGGLATSISNGVVKVNANVNASFFVK